MSSFSTTDSYVLEVNWTSIIAVLITNVFTATIVTVVFVWTIYKLFLNKERIMKSNQCAIWLTFSGITLHWILGITDFFLFYYYEVSFSDFKSNIFYHIWFVIWALCRLNIYLVYVYRLFSIFKETAHRHETYVYILVSIGGFISASCIIASLIVGQSINNNSEDNNNNEDIIVLTLETVFLIVDILLIISLIWLFLKPLVKLFNYHITISNIKLSSIDKQKKEKTETSTKNQTIDHEENEEDVGILAAAVRLLILAIVALTSSVFYQLIWLISLSIEHANYDLYLFAYSWGVDNVINIICLYLSYSFAKNEYDKLCKCCGLQKCCMNHFHS